MNQGPSPCAKGASENSPQSAAGILPADQTLVLSQSGHAAADQEYQSHAKKRFFWGPDEA
jgi:hypothetical protein